MFLHGKKPGSMMTSGGGAFRNTESSGLTPHEQEAVQFARVINHYLQSCQEQRQFETLTIVAEPHFLGKLKSAMSPRLLNAVVSWIEKDYMNISYEELPSIIKKNENRVYPIHR
jgi:protein required for attachment to host cells